jgi:ribosomal protein S18 acetylase RimI-like enzyme
MAEGTVFIQGDTFVVRPVGEDELNAVLEVYRQCEDFLVLGPEPHASMRMVLDDIGHSKAGNGVFCGIYNAEGIMMGILDVIPRGFEGNPRHAFISLLMIAAPFRNAGLGTQVIRALEREIVKDDQIEAILSGVQVNNPAAIKFWQNNGYLIIGGPEHLPDRTVAFRLRKPA